MSVNHNHEIDEIQVLEKSLKVSEEIRQHAIASKKVYEDQLEGFDKELVALGTTAEKGQQDIEKIDKQYQENVEKLKQLIPFDLLKKYGKLDKIAPPDVLNQLGILTDEF